METRILLGAVGALVHICKKFESIKLKSLWLDGTQSEWAQRMF